MNYEIFSIPIDTQSDELEELNAFLNSHAIINVRKELANSGMHAYWTFVVEYRTDKGKNAVISKNIRKSAPKVDYKEVLAPEDFDIYSKIRDWRRETATKEGVQLYTVFNNEQMAKMVTDKIMTVGGLKKIDGIGEARIEKYGAAVIEILKRELGKRNQTDEAGV